MTASFFNYPSPNHNARPPSQAINMLVLHYTGLPSTQSALARLCDRQSKVSAHYLIDEGGGIFVLVDEARRAWHAGVAYWAGENDINACSIGIELAHKGHNADGTCDPFPQAQMEACADLASQLLARYNIPPQRILGHSDVAPARKIDPGEAFDWAWLAARDIGLWPQQKQIKDKMDDIKQNAIKQNRADKVLCVDDKGEQVRQLQTDLADFGYGTRIDGFYGADTKAVICAFQRHFRPQQIDGCADRETRACLQVVRQLCQ